MEPKVVVAHRSSGGALRSPASDTDFIFEHRASAQRNFYVAQMPESYDMRQNSQPSRDQGDRETCAAHAAAAIKEIQENRDSGFKEQMSTEFIYHHRVNKPSPGMYGRDVFKILAQIGSVPERLYPGLAVEPAAEPAPPSQAAYQLAANYKIATFARITTIDGLKKALLEMGPCYLQLPLFAGRPCFWRAKKGEQSSCGHAVAVVGYDRNGFILKNSWGPHWNGDGCVTFPYSDWSIHWECWASIDEKSKPAAEISDMSPTDTTHAITHSITHATTHSAPQIRDKQITQKESSMRKDKEQTADEIPRIQITKPNKIPKEFNNLRTSQGSAEKKITPRGPIPNNQPRDEQPREQHGRSFLDRLSPRKSPRETPSHVTLGRTIEDEPGKEKKKKCTIL
jgi:hypothetical protein